MTIREYTKKYGLSFDDFATIIGVHVSYVFMLSKKTRVPSPELAARIAELTDDQIQFDRIGCSRNDWNKRRKNWTTHHNES